MFHIVATLSTIVDWEDSQTILPLLQQSHSVHGAGTSQQFQHEIIHPKRDNGDIFDQPRCGYGERIEHPYGAA